MTGCKSILFIALGAILLVVSSHGRDHVVKRGETLSRIALRYGVTKDAIISANNIRNPNLILPGKRLTIPEKSSITYAVKRGDSLSIIAQRHGTSVSKIVSANGLRDANSIQVGQKLKIPTSSNSSKASGSNAREVDLLGATLVNQLRAITPTRGKWKGIVIHHTATPEASAKGLDNYHRQQRKMQNGLAYHFVIGNGKGMRDGEIHIGNRWKKQQDGGHLKLEKWNKENIGICLVGNFQAHYPTRAQMDKLEGLIRVLLKQCRLTSSKVTTHKLKHKNHTVCPGKLFSFLALKKRLAK